MNDPITRLEIAIPLTETGWTLRRRWLGIRVPARVRTTVDHVAVVLPTGNGGATLTEPYAYPAASHRRRRALEAAIAAESCACG